MDIHMISFTINGVEETREVPSNMTLLTFLRVAHIPSRALKSHGSEERLRRW